MIISIILSGFFIGCMIFLGLDSISKAIASKNKFEITNYNGGNYKKPHPFIKQPPISHEDQMKYNSEYARMYNETIDSLVERSNKKIEEGLQEIKTITIKTKP